MAYAHPRPYFSHVAAIIYDCNAHASKYERPDESAAKPMSRQEWWTAVKTTTVPSSDDDDKAHSTHQT